MDRTPLRLPLLLGVGLLCARNVFAAPPAPCELKGPPPPFPEIRLEPVAKKPLTPLSLLSERLQNPLGLLHAGGRSGRIFIVEQGGTVRIWKNGELSEKPFLDIRERVVAGGEKGLLGLAFHPKFSENRRFFVNYTSSEGGLHTVISEFKVGAHPDEGDPKSERILLTIPQPYPNHNGGQIAFGPDGYLYIGMGDGGSGNDPLGNGQNLGVLLGKMLRIDVDGKDGGREYGIPPDNPFIGKENARPEIWAYGLRNPWRFSFDAVTGFLYAGDVGQDDREEIDVIQKGRNYGWNIMEGTICAPGVNPRCDKRGLELPIYDYPREEGTTVIGGYVYRGRSIPSLCGAYVYGDFGNGRIWALRYDGKKMTDHRLLLETKRMISSFGEDGQRELYAVDYKGEVLKVVPAQKR